MEIGKSICTYWFPKLNLPVTFPFGKFLWKGIYGVQIKGVFIGVIIGDKQDD